MQRFTFTIIHSPAAAAQHPLFTSGRWVRIPALLEVIDVAKIWARSNTAEPSRFSRMNAVKRMPSF